MVQWYMNMLDLVRWPIYNIKSLATMTCDISKPEKTSFVEIVFKTMCFKWPSKKITYDLIIVVE